MTFSNYDPVRISRALDRALARALAQEEEEGPRILDLNDDQIVIFSDQHKGARNVADDFQVRSDGVDANITTPWGKGNLTSSLLGRFNISKLLAVISNLCFMKKNLKGWLN